MIASRSPKGWQTTLADLALILFMVTAATIAERPQNSRNAAAETVFTTAPAQGEALAIYRAAPNAPPLAEWLANQPRDGRQSLTIIARHQPGGAAAAAQAALALERASAAAGHSARIAIEPADHDDLVAVLAFAGRPPAASAAAAYGTQVALSQSSATDER